jgi:hypothetical protein
MSTVTYPPTTHPEPQSPQYNGHEFATNPNDRGVCANCGYRWESFSSFAAGELAPQEIAQEIAQIPPCPGRWPHDPPKAVVQFCDACGYDGSAKHLCNHFAWAAETNRLLKRLIGLATLLTPGAKPELPGNAAGYPDTVMTGTMKYPCGCSANGPENLPTYCPQHGKSGDPGAVFVPDSQVPTPIETAGQ